MADQKGSEITERTTLAGTDRLFGWTSSLVNFKATVANLQAHLAQTFLSDAPSDGSTYGRKDGAWAAIAAGGGSKHVIQDEGSSLTERTNLNFVGAGVTVTDDSGNDRSVVTIPNPVTTHESTFNHSSYDSHVAAASPHSGHLDTGDIGSTVQAHDADTAKTDVTRAWTKLQHFTPLVGGTSGAITLDFEDGNVIHSTLTGAVTSVALPTNMNDGAQCVWRVSHPGGGAVAIGGWNASYKFTAATAPTVSTTAGAGESFVIERKGSEYWVTYAGDFR